jgi:hypothetical protein
VDPALDRIRDLRVTEQLVECGQDLFEALLAGGSDDQAAERPFKFTNLGQQARSSGGRSGLETSRTEGRKARTMSLRAREPN